MATKVKLRQKTISGKKFSLYLDFYPAIPHPETGNPTRREFLGMYLFDKPKNTTDKQHNEDTLWLSQKRMSELFGVEVHTVNYHLKEIFKSNELQEDSVFRKIRITAEDGKNYLTNLYKW